MALEIKLSQKLSQTLVMTPQLQQAIKLLQLGRQDYLAVIEKELLENPVLEDVREGDEEQYAGGMKEDSSAQEAQDKESEQPRVNLTQTDPRNVVPEADFDAPTGGTSDSPLEGPGPKANEPLDGGQEFVSFEHGGGYRSDGYRERPSLEATVSNPEGLTSHLLWQLRTAEIGQCDQEIIAQILGSLDRNGYLSCSVGEMAEGSGSSVEDVERVLSVVHTLDPPGIAARNLRECLLIQLDQLGMFGTLIWKVVSEYLGDLEVRRYDAIARQEQVSVEEVYEAVKEIQKLEPRPGRPFVDEAPIYITPDVYVRKVGNEYVVSLNETGIPRIRLNSQYQELAQSAGNGAGLDREYLQDRLRSASWLIKSIHQRQQTIYRVTESIMNFQRNFLELGVSALRPLVLRDVAADVGMHESTVSRVTTNKYVHTPRGVFELKFFFSSGLKSGTGEVSSESVKERIRELISKENPRKPLSDQAIVNTLIAEGIDIARRTVAKYREMMQILSSSRRKKMF